jgi:hypothetical protein
LGLTPASLVHPKLGFISSFACYPYFPAHPRLTRRTFKYNPASIYHTHHDVHRSLPLFQSLPSDLPAMLLPVVA